MIDITLDFETLSLSAKAAPLQLSAIAWKRSDNVHPYECESIKKLPVPVFRVNFDIRDAIYHGLDIDPNTVDWWSKQSEEAKKCVLGKSESFTIAECIGDFLFWLDDIKKETGENNILIWIQGSDFDMPILKNLLCIAGQTKTFNDLVPYTNIRDARTFILEAGRHAIGDGIQSSVDVSAKAIYDSLPADPAMAAESEGSKHTAIYDCKRTTWAVWNFMHK